jgi:hypothetical protein
VCGVTASPTRAETGCGDQHLRAAAGSTFTARQRSLCLQPHQACAEKTRQCTACPPARSWCAGCCCTAATWVMMACEPPGVAKALPNVHKMLEQQPRIHSHASRAGLQPILLRIVPRIKAGLGLPRIRYRRQRGAARSCW